MGLFVLTMYINCIESSYRVQKRGFSVTDSARQEKRKAKSLSDIFNEFARDSAERFPTSKGRLLIIDTNENVYYGADDLDLKKAGYREDLVEKKVNEWMNADLVQTCADSEDNKLNLYMIMYNEPVPKSQHTSVPLKTEKEILFTMDHELGHLVIKKPAMKGENKQYRTLVDENIADAFAVIRHYQRSGMKSDYHPLIIDPWARAAGLVLHGDTTHFTTTMHEEIDKLKGKIDYSALSPQQTIELARRFGTAYSPSASAVNRLYTKLKPVRELFEEHPRSALWMKKLVDITLDLKNDDYTFRICKMTLEGFMDGRKDAYGASIKITGPYWDQVKKDLATMDERRKKEGIAFNLDVSLQPPPNDQIAPGKTAFFRL